MIAVTSQIRYHLHDFLEKGFSVTISTMQLVEYQSVLDKQDTAAVAGCKCIVGHHYNSRPFLLIQVFKIIQQHGC